MSILEISTLALTAICAAVIVGMGKLMARQKKGEQARLKQATGLLREQLEAREKTLDQLSDENDHLVARLNQAKWETERWKRRQAGAQRRADLAVEKLKKMKDERQKDI